MDNRLSADVRDFMVMYEQALGLFKQKEYDRAWQLLEDFARQRGARSLVAELLKAQILWEQKKYVTEIDLLEALLEIYGDSKDHKRLAAAYRLLGGAYGALGQSRKAVEAYLCSASLEPEAVKALEEISNVLFNANAIEGVSAAEMQEFYGLYRSCLLKLAAEAYPPPGWRHGKIRVGYLSADLQNHAVGQFVRPFFFDFDGRDFEVFVYQLNEEGDPVTENLRQAPVCWRDLAGCSFAEVARAIRRDEIDILMELGGHTGSSALPVLAYRAARVQICGIGYFGSTGMAECDGFLSDIHCAPAEDSPYFTEKLLRLPHTHFCYQPYKKFPEVAPPPCLTRGYITFGSFNNFGKVNDGVLRLWGEIMVRVPGSRLLLKHKLLGTEEGRQYTIERLRRLGLPLERIELRDYSLAYLQEYGDMDIALDTSPYTGGLTTCEALYMGVPVVTLSGNRHGARFGVSFLHNVGLGELVADSREEYVAKAAALAGDCEFLALLRSKLRHMMQESALMDSRAYMRDVENLYRALSVSENDGEASGPETSDMDKKKKEAQHEKPEGASKLADRTAVEKVLSAERAFLARHMEEESLPLEALVEELEPIFRELGWRRPMGEAPAILLQHSEANGDFVMASPVLRELRKCYPDSFITLVVPSSCRELAEKCPYVNEVLTRPKTSSEYRWQDYFADLLLLLPDGLKRRYDLGFTWNEARGEMDKLWLYLAGVCQRVGHGPYVFEGAELKPEARLWYGMLTLSVPRDRGEALRDSEKALRLLEAVTGMPALDRGVEVWTDEEDERAAAAVLKELRARGYSKVYAVMPGVSEARRRWPVERWAQFAAVILSREPKVGLVILGGPKEKEIASRLKDELCKNHPGRVIQAAGKLTFSGTAALLKRCRKYLGNDTGALHLAVAQKVPILVPYAYPLDLKLHTVSMPVRFAPWGVPAVQVFPKEHRDDCHDIDGPGCSRKYEAHCILGISVETMLYAYEALNMQIAKGAQKPIRFC